MIYSPSGRGISSEEAREAVPPQKIRMRKSFVLQKYANITKCDNKKCSSHSFFLKEHCPTTTPSGEVTAAVCVSSASLELIENEASLELIENEQSI